MQKFIGLVAVLVVGACGTRAPKYLEDLKPPSLVWTQGNMLCSKIVAVDGDRVVWKDQGCEDGRPTLDQVRTATEAEVEDLWAKFGLLPLDQGTTFDTCSTGLLHRFARWDAQSRTGTSACGGTQYDDIASLPDMFQPLATAIRDLE